MTHENISKTKVRDLPSVDPRLLYIVLDGNDTPQDINPSYLGIFSDMKIRQWVKDQHAKNHTTPETVTEEQKPQPYLMLARVGALGIHLTDEANLIHNERLVSLNAAAQAAWKTANEAKQGRSERFEKYFFGMANNNNALQGTSSLLSTVEEVQALIDKSHAHTLEMNARIADSNKNNGTDYPLWPEKKYFISVFRVEVNWPHMVEQSRATYLVHHKPEDFEWNLGDKYDADGTFIGGDYTKTYPKDYRAEPHEAVMQMMENIRSTKLVSQSIADAYDRLRAEGRLCENADEENVLREFRRVQALRAKRDN